MSKVFTVASLLVIWGSISGCAKKIDPALQYNWKLSSVRCNGNPSPIGVLSDSTLQDPNGGVGLAVTYDGVQGKRVWTLGSCQVTYNFTEVIYADASLIITEAAPVCTGDCSAFASTCTAQGNTATYAYSVSNDTLKLVIPKTDASVDPCDSNWSQEADFSYTKVK